MGSHVAGALHPGRQDVALALEQCVAGVVEQHAVVVRVLTGDERGPRGAAERRRDHSVGERRAFLPQQLQCSRHRLRIHRLQGLIVGHDQDHVRPRGAVLGPPREHGDGAGRYGQGRDRGDEDQRPGRPGPGGRVRRPPGSFRFWAGGHRARDLCWRGALPSPVDRLRWLLTVLLPKGEIAVSMIVRSAGYAAAR